MHQAIVGAAGTLVTRVMSKQLVTIGRNDTLLAADRLMQANRIRHLLVLDDDGRLTGVLSRRDLFRGALARALGWGSLAQDRLLDTLLVKDAMSEPVITASVATTLREAARTMIDREIGCLPIFAGSALVGVITEGDFVRMAAR